MKKDLRTRAHLLLQKRRYKDAEKAYRKLSLSFPSDPEVLYPLGIASSELNDYDSAIDCFKKILLVQPTHGMASHRLAKAYLAQNKYQLAEECFKHAMQFRRQDHLVYADYSKLLRETSRPEQAKKCLELVTRLAPTYAAAYQTLGELFLEKRDFHNAARNFEKAISINQNLPLSHEYLGDCLFSIGQLANAEKHYQRAIKYSRRSIRPLLRSGSVLLLLGKTRESEERYRLALRIDKDNHDALIGIANAQLQGNQANEALQTITPLLNEAVADDGLSHVYTKICLKLGMPDKAISYLESSLNAASSSKHMVHTYYALGKLEDHIKEYNKAFSYYGKANELESYSYDAPGHAKSTDLLIDTCSRATMLALPRAKHDTRRPIFIVGMPRSGTTLVEQVISSLPSVYGAGELITLGNIAASLRNRDGITKTYPEFLPDLSQGLINELSHEYLHELQKIDATAERVIDKMPHNFVYLGLIELLFPHATVIHCMRNPVDTCLSIYFQKFNASHGYANDLNDLSMHYRQYLRLMNHWKQALTIPIYDVHYESLISDLEGASKKVADFCGLRWDSQCLNFHSSSRFVNTASNEQVNKPIYTGSVERWRYYEKHIQPLLSLLGKQ